MKTRPPAGKDVQCDIKNVEYTTVPSVERYKLTTGKRVIRSCRGVKRTSAFRYQCHTHSENRAFTGQPVATRIELVLQDVPLFE
jgi:hypothetical protein